MSWEGGYLKAHVRKESCSVCMYLKKHALRPSWKLSLVFSRDFYLGKLPIKMSLVDLEQRTVLRALDAVGAEDPERLYCIQPISSNISQG